MVGTSYTVARTIRDRIRDGPADPRGMDDDELAEVPDPPQPADPSAGSPVVEDEYAEGRTSDPTGADRDAPAGEDYAGSGL